MAAAEEVDDASNGDPSDQMPAMRKQVEELAFGQFLNLPGAIDQLGHNLSEIVAPGQINRATVELTLFLAANHEIIGSMLNLELDPAPETPLEKLLDKPSFSLLLDGAVRASRGSRCFKNLREQKGEQVAELVGKTVSLAEDDEPKATHIRAVKVLKEFALQAVVIAVKAINNEGRRAAAGPYPRSRTFYGF